MISCYKNGNTNVMINLETGEKLRQTNDNVFRPVFPEAMDVTITYKCDGNCPYCYINANENGRHADLDSEYINSIFLPSIKPYTEMAINGNDLSHPQLEDFLIKLKKRNIIANLTVNQKHFLKNINKLKDWSDKRLIKGLGISLIYVDDNLINNIKQFKNAVVHTIAGIHLNEFRQLENNNIKILILGYKEVGKGKNYNTINNSLIKRNINLLNQYLNNIINNWSNNNYFNTISFDTLAIEQLHINDILSEEEYNKMYQGEEGSFTFFVDLVNNKYGINSITDKLYDINNLPVQDMFCNIKII